MKEPWEIKIYQEHGKKTLVEAIILSYQRIGLIKEHKDAKQTIQFISQFLLDIPHHALIHFKTSQNEIHYEEDYAAVRAFIQNYQDRKSTRLNSRHVAITYADCCFQKKSA